MDNMMKSATRWMLGLTAVCIILWAIVPSWKPVMLGLAVGLAASAMNAFLLKRRVALVAEIASQEGTQTKRKGLGFGSRVAMVLLVAMFAVKYPETLNLPAALSGSMVFPFLILVVALIHNAKTNNSGKG
ncbi:ATP synthase subunit I [Paenibacillus endoradicis]|uniref:ATP synthase subunit I n=1 Tax=Paenibacillus endoradicis TaxID=2972487 RepID=UPI00215969AE|nr:ATP synthase subunit I [Paenibacillus endoradicis]MCR8660460.1 ATP synthase subunit I [Paenibacillus endoradicis]